MVTELKCCCKSYIKKQMCRSQQLTWSSQTPTRMTGGVIFIFVYKPSCSNSTHLFPKWHWLTFMVRQVMYPEQAHPYSSLGIGLALSNLGEGPRASALQACDGSGSPDDLRIGLSPSFVFEKQCMFINQIAIWSGLIGSKKSNSIPSFCPIFCFLQSKMVLFLLIQSHLYSWLPLQQLITSMVHTHIDLLMQWSVHHTLRVLFQTGCHFL